MIISRTPFRISFVGGGTDLESFYAKEDGQVLSSTIDKFVYVTVKRQTSIPEYKYRVSWSKVEFKDRVEDIEHPIVREALKLMKIDFPMEITTFADIPANTGLGSSSSFTVGLLHALFALKGEMVTKAALASLGARIEVDILGRVMGKQDHYAAAYGNFNVFTFHKNGTVSVEPVFYRPEVKEALEDHLMLFYTRLRRDVSEVLTAQVKNADAVFDSLRQMKDLVPSLRQILSDGGDINAFAGLLHKNWTLKRNMSSLISNAEIDAAYERALRAGAGGGKLLGAGGGGFLLLCFEPRRREAIARALSNFVPMRFKFDNAGSRITYYDQSLC